MNKKTEEVASWPNMLSRVKMAVAELEDHLSHDPQPTTVNARVRKIKALLGGFFITWRAFR